MATTKQKAPQILINGDTLSIRFDRFDQPAYELFLRVKRLPEYRVEFDREAAPAHYTISAPSRFAPMLGLPLPQRPKDDLPISSFLFDDQKAGVRLALDAKRFAVWFDTGLGKTNIFLEWSRHVSHRTGGRVLIVTLANLINQTIDEAKKFYGDKLPILALKTKAMMREWCQHGTVDGAPFPEKIAIVNYEKFNPETPAQGGQIINEIRHLAGVVLDESSRLAMGGGVQKWAIIHSTKGIPYKLSCTATPAPNATMEFASQASFLERMRAEGEIIWTYFTRDSKTHRWGVKKHAKAAFFEFMSSWSIYVRDPRRFGWRNGMTEVPPPIIKHYKITPTPEQLSEAAKINVLAGGQMQLWADQGSNTIARSKLSQIAKGFRYAKEGEGRKTIWIPSLKPAAVAQIAKEDLAAGLQVLIWTVFDAETDLITESLKAAGVIDFATITGKVPKGKRGPILEAFRTGKTPLLSSRASMLGFGMNFQCCGSMIFSGWSDSYVGWYQAIRRAYRYGQKKSVRVHVPVIQSLEGEMLDNIAGKESRHEAEIRDMEANYLAAMKHTGLLGSLAKGRAA